MGKATLRFFVPSLGSYMPTNLLVGDATAVGEEGSAAGIGAGAAVDDDDAGVVIVTPFAWASLSFSQNFFQWNWMQNGDLVLEWGALLGWAVCTNGFHRRKVGRIEVAFLYTHQAISINFVRSNPAPKIDRGGRMAERKKKKKCFP